MEEALDLSSDRIPNEINVPTVGLITHQLLGAVAIFEKQAANLFRNVQFCNRA